MRRAPLLVALSLLGLAQAASAQPVDPSPPAAIYGALADEIVIDCPPRNPEDMPCAPIVISWRSYVDNLLATVDDAVADDVTAADDTTTRASAVVAYGEGTTQCAISVSKTAVNGSATNWSFEGSTTCDRMVQQTGQAMMTGAGTAYAPLCSGTRSSCRSSGSATGAYTEVRYHVTLVAPAGQGWVAPPAECSGAGTDRLECTF